MSLLHKVQLVLERIGFSRWMVDPHNGAEFWTAFFTWLMLLFLLAMVYMAFEQLGTPKWVRLDPTHKYSLVYRVCRWYVVYAFLALVAWVTIPWVSPALAAYLTMK